MSHLLCTSIIQATSSTVLPDLDRRVLVALGLYMQHVENGLLIHGPLLGWATVMGDSLVKFRSEATGPAYFMPQRLGVPFKEYPWTQHGIRHERTHAHAPNYHQPCARGDLVASMQRDTPVS